MNDTSSMLKYIYSTAALPLPPSRRRQCDRRMIVQAGVVVDFFLSPSFGFDFISLIHHSEPGPDSPPPPLCQVAAAAATVAAAVAVRRSRELRRAGAATVAASAVDAAATAAPAPPPSPISPGYV